MCFTLGNTKPDIKYTQNNKIGFIFSCETVWILAGSSSYWILPFGEWEYKAACPMACSVSAIREMKTAPSPFFVFFPFFLLFFFSSLQKRQIPQCCQSWGECGEREKQESKGKIIVHEGYKVPTEQNTFGLLHLMHCLQGFVLW